MKPTTLSLAALAVFWTAFWWTGITGQEVLYARDLTLLAGPLRAYGAERWLTGDFPLWSPFVAGGAPHLAEAAYQALYPPNLIFALTGSDQANTWFAAGHTALALAAMYLLTRSFGTDRIIAVWAAILYVTSGYVVSLTDNMTYFPAVGWVPLGLFAWRALPGATGPIVAAIASAAMLLTGDALNAGVLVLLVLFLPRIYSPSSLGHLAAWLVVAGGGMTLAAAQVLPTLDLLDSSVRSGGLPPAEGLTWSFPPARILELVHPFPYGSHYPVFDFLGAALYEQPAPWADSVYLGLIPCALAIYAASKRLPGSGVWLAAAAVFLLLSLGRHLPFAETLYLALPIINGQRYPEKLVFWVTLCLVILAAMGANALVRGAARPPIRLVTRVSVTLAVSGLVLSSLYIAVAQIAGDEAWRASRLWQGILGVPNTHIAASLSHALIGVSLVSGWFWMPPRRLKIYTYALLGFAALNTAWIHRVHLPMAPPQALDGPLSLVSSLTAQAAFPRVYFDPDFPGQSVSFAPGRLSHLVVRVLPPDEDIYLNGYAWIYRARFFLERMTTVVGIPYGIRYLNGRFAPLGPRRNRQWEKRLTTQTAPEMLSRAGVNYVITGIEPVNPLWTSTRLKEIFRDNEINVRLLEVPDPAPRFRLNGSRGGATGRIRAKWRSPEHVSLAVYSPSPATTVLTTESFARGWQATVNGNPTPIGLSDGRFMSVPVPQGQSELVLTYRPRWLTLGLTVSACAWLLSVIVLAYSVFFRARA